jgi:uncharacterized protein YhhL (DUF1145 family)
MSNVLKSFSEKLSRIVFGHFAIKMLFLAILLTIVFCYSKHFQLAAICVLYIFIYFMLGHILQAFYDLTHMDEFRARMHQKRLDKQSLKEYLNNNNCRKRWIIF